MRELQVRDWGCGVDYAIAWQAMQEFTLARTAHTPDEIWLVEHAPVYTRGRNAKEVAPSGCIPAFDTDRGGDLTYHGPGQLVVYTLFDLTRLGLGVRDLVSGIEQTILLALGGFGVGAHTRAGAPGVYVEGAKIASLGLRIRGGRSYHGLALNVAMDLAPFSSIAPCGSRGLRMTQLVDCGGPGDTGVVSRALIEEFLAYFRFTLKEDLHDRPCRSDSHLLAHAEGPSEN